MSGADDARPPSQVGQVWKIHGPDDLKLAESQKNVNGFVLMDASDWKV
jgi:hypothetical protein